MGLCCNNFRIQSHWLYRLSSYRKSSLLLLVVIPIQHVIDFPFGFDLLPVIQFAFLCGCDIQEIPGCLVRLLVVTEQVKGTLDVRHLLHIETGFSSSRFSIKHEAWNCKCHILI